ncbi:MAG: alpha-amylase family protein [Bacteroidota bacterium]
MYNPKAQLFLKDLLVDLRKKFGSSISGDFELRLSALFHDIYERFYHIYGHKESVDKELKNLIFTLAKGYVKRPEKLKERDATREKDPGWFRSQEIVGMMLYIDRFCRNLKNFGEKIDYLEELGVNLAHLMPLLDSPKGKRDGGYAVSNYRKVDKRFGTNADLQKVINRLHEKDMLLMMDLVINHTSDEHDWAKKAKSGEDKYQDYYYTFDDRTVPDLFERALPEVFPESSPGNFTYNEQLQRWVMTVFNSYQWDLNYTNPQVLIEMIDIVLFQANWGIDVLRLDAVAFIWKQMGTKSQNLPQAHIILQLYKLCTQVVAPGVAFVAEAIVEPHEIIQYFGQSNLISNECDIAYNATMMALMWDSVSTHSTRVMNLAMNDLPPKPMGTTWINYIRCHDDIGLGYADQHISHAGFTPKMHRDFVVSFLTGKYRGAFATGMPFMYNPKTGDARISGALASLAGLESALKRKDELDIRHAQDRIITMHAVMMAYGGIPMLYYGDEVATVNDYSFLEDKDRKDDNRWVHRPLIDWDHVDQRNVEGTSQRVIFSALQKLIELRKVSPELADNNNLRIVDLSNENLFAFVRNHNDHPSMLIANFNDHKQYIHQSLLSSIHPDITKIKDKYKDETITIEDDCLVLGPFKFAWLCCNQ